MAGISGNWQVQMLPNSDSIRGINISTLAGPYHRHFYALFKLKCGVLYIYCLINEQECFRPNKTRPLKKNKKK
jgi:hypothetical protein